MSPILLSSESLCILTKSGVEIEHYHVNMISSVQCMELTIIHGFGHNCMELNQGKHGVESENHAVHEPCSVGNLCDGFGLNMEHGNPGDGLWY